MTDNVLRILILVLVFASVLLLAFAGGLILNLMPCVLPVLAMKLASVVKLDASAQRDVRAAFRP